jgi:hypothetical protein
VVVARSLYPQLVRSGPHSSMQIFVKNMKKLSLLYVGLTAFVISTNDSFDLSALSVLREFSEMPLVDNHLSNNLFLFTNTEKCADLVRIAWNDIEPKLREMYPIGIVRTRDNI